MVQPITYNFTSPLLSNTNYVGLFSDFWGYFEPIRQNMPKNCSADVQLVIAHIDQVLESGDQTQITNLMASFGLGNLTHTDDFVSVRACHQFTFIPEPRDNERFYQFLQYETPSWIGNRSNRIQIQVSISSNFVILWRSRTVKTLPSLGGVWIMPLKHGALISGMITCSRVSQCVC